jgi:hypothetical protein
MSLLTSFLSINLHNILRLQEVAIIGGCPTDVISPPEFSEMCVDGGCWNLKF